MGMKRNLVLATALAISATQAPAQAPQPVATAPAAAAPVASATTISHGVGTFDAAGVRELPAAAEIADMLGAWRAGGQAGPGATSWQAGPAVHVGRPGAPVPGQPEQPAPMGPPAAPPRP